MLLISIFLFEFFYYITPMSPLFFFIIYRRNAVLDISVAVDLKLQIVPIVQQVGIRAKMGTTKMSVVNVLVDL